MIQEAFMGPVICLPYRLSTTRKASTLVARETA